MSGWGDWQSPDEQAAQQRAAEEAQQRAGMTEFEKQAIAVQGRMVDVLDAIGATLGRLQPAAPICNQCGAPQPIAGEGQPITFDGRAIARPSSSQPATPRSRTRSGRLSSRTSWPR